MFLKPYAVDLCCGRDKGAASLAVPNAGYGFRAIFWRHFSPNTRPLIVGWGHAGANTLANRCGQPSQPSRANKSLHKPKNQKSKIPIKSYQLVFLHIHTRKATVLHIAGTSRSPQELEHRHMVVVLLDQRQRAPGLARRLDSASSAAAAPRQTLPKRHLVGFAARPTSGAAPRHRQAAESAPRSHSRGVGALDREAGPAAVACRSG